VPSPPEPTDLWTERPARVPGGSEPRPRLARPLVRAWVDRWLAYRTGSRRRSIAKAKPVALALADVWNAWAVAEVECALALRAWQLAPRRDKRASYDAYRAALEREALIAGELRLRTAP
jgi:hypothetical protein